VFKIKNGIVVQSRMNQIYPYTERFEFSLSGAKLKDCTIKNNPLKISKSNISIK